MTQELAEQIAESMATTDRPSGETVEINEIGALRQWKEELFAGLRRLTNPPDALHIAAAYETSARDDSKQGLIPACNAARRRAAEIILEAVTEKAT